MSAMRTACLAAMLFSTAMAYKCTPGDQLLWETKGKGEMTKDMHGCSIKCHALSDCTTKCLSGIMAYTQPCAKCFGDLAYCARRHCFVRCLGPLYKSKMCEKCIKATCVEPFKSCTGVADLMTAPTRRLSESFDMFEGIAGLEEDASLVQV